MNVYQDIAQRTSGDIYIGVVGPVRTGKSTFIKKFMEALVLPNIENPIKRERALDELPQSASGRTIMTAEPKFIPAEAVEVEIAEGAHMSVRMIDCVGYVVRGASGYEEDGEPRMVNTPWSDNSMPFEKAAEMGTKKVITEHSTVGILVTTDGSITGIDREEYEEAEARVAYELKEMGKPFVILLNTVYPYTQEANDLAESMQEKYGVSVVVADVMNMPYDKLDEIFAALLDEFSVADIVYRMPVWFKAMRKTPEALAVYCDAFRQISDANDKLGSIRAKIEEAATEELQFDIADIEAGTGTIYVDVNPDKRVFYDMLSDISGEDIADDYRIVEYLALMAEIRKEYDDIKDALISAKTTGYGVVMPNRDDITTKAPQRVYKSGRYGMNVIAHAETMHIICADVYAKVSPVIGADESSVTVIENMLADYESDNTALWNMEIFGRTLGDMIEDNIASRVMALQPKTKKRLQNAVTKASNGESGVIVIVL